MAVFQNNKTSKYDNYMTPKYAWENINSAAAEMYNKFHDEASWEEESNKRMDVIGQNGNEGLHYDKEKPKPKRRYYKPKKKK